MPNIFETKLSQTKGVCMGPELKFRFAMAKSSLTSVFISDEMSIRRFKILQAQAKS